jgi:hypothetical protein
VRPPGAAKFQSWLPASMEAFAVFDASSPLWSGPGAYAFRVRYVDTSTGAVSRYSSVRAINVT